MSNWEVHCTEEGLEGQVTWPLCLKRDQENVKENYPRGSFSRLVSCYSGSTLITSALRKPKSWTAAEGSVSATEMTAVLRAVGLVASLEEQPPNSLVFNSTSYLKSYPRKAPGAGLPPENYNLNAAGYPWDGKSFFKK